MSWRTSYPAIQARKLIRTLGLRRVLSRLLPGGGYENAFHEAMLARLKAGTIVWDVGANVGMYSEIFAQAAGPQGQVFAFEPSPRNRAALAANVAALPTVTIMPMALGATAATMKFLETDIELGDHGVTSRISDAGNVEVAVQTGDALVASAAAPVPHFIKIDVEGFELDVLQGMRALLARPELSTVAIEVHFGELAARGQADAPAQIEKIVAASGLKCRWTDPSHLMATRG